MAASATPDGSATGGTSAVVTTEQSRDIAELVTEASGRELLVAGTLGEGVRRAAVRHRSALLLPAANTTSQDVQDANEAACRHGIPIGFVYTWSGVQSARRHADHIFREFVATGPDVRISIHHVTHEPLASIGSIPGLEVIAGTAWRPASVPSGLLAVDTHGSGITAHVADHVVCGVAEGPGPDGSVAWERFLPCGSGGP